MSDLWILQLPVMEKVPRAGVGYAFLLIGAATVLGLNALVAAAVYASRRVERFVDGDPVIIVTDGRLLRPRLRRELITENEALAAVRDAGVQDLADVRLAILESTVEINVFAVDGKP